MSDESFRTVSSVSTANDSWSVFAQRRTRAAALFFAIAAYVSGPARAADAEPPADSAPAPDPAEPADPPVDGSGETDSVSPPGTEETETSDTGATEGEAEASGAVVTEGGGLFAQSVSGGGETATESTDMAAPAPLPYELGGYTRGDIFIGKIPGDSIPEIKAAYGELALKLNIKKGEFGGAYAEPRFRYGQQGDQRQLFVDLREAYVDAYFGDLDLRLGQQIIVWGRADAFNPTNNLTPSDLRIRSPNEDDRRVGNVGARAYYNLSPVRLEAVWMPLYLPVEFPAVAIPEFVTLTEPDFPGMALSYGTYAGRLHLELSSFETSVSYLHGYAPLPGFALAGPIVVGPLAEVPIARTAYQHDVIGFDFSTAIADEIGVRGEAAYRMPADYEGNAHVAKPDVQYVLGLDKSFGSVSAIAQYMGRYVMDWEEIPPPLVAVSANALSQFTAVSPAVQQTVEGEIARRNQSLFQQLAEVQHLVSLRLEWLTLHETLSLSAIGLMNFTTEEWAVFPKAEYKVTDGMSATVGGEIYAGPDGTLFGLIDAPLSAAYAELKVAF